MPDAVRELIGVYDADGTLLGEARYWIGARLGRTHCSLCEITHGLFTERADWRVRGYALASLRASWRPAANWELFARVSNVLDRRYETYGAVAPDLFPNGRLLKPHEGEMDAEHSRFVAPGAPRTVIAGVRYTF